MTLTELILWSAFFILMVLVTIADIRTMEIPDGLVLAVLVLGILAAVLVKNITLWERVAGFAGVSLPLLVITLFAPGAFGGGDIKLMAAGGFFLGFRLTLLGFVVAVLAGAVYGVWLLMKKKKAKNESFAFGPFLCGGMAVALMYNILLTT